MKENKVKFLTYFKVLNNSVTESNKGTFGTGIASGIIMYTELAVLYSIIGGQGLPILCLMSMFLPQIAYIFLQIAKTSPCPFSLMPISPARKTLFFFLSLMLAFLEATIGITVFFTIIMLVFALITLAASGEWIVTVEESVENSVYVCTQGEILGVAIFLCLIGTALIIGSSKRKIPVWITVIAPAAIVLSLFIIMKAYGIKDGGLFIYMDSIPFGYIYTTLYSVAGAVLTAAGIVKTAQLFKPSDY